MQESLYVTGIVLKQTPFGEYDRIVSLLTREKGKITAFARGARKPGNRLAAATNPFAFGTFRLYEGRTSILRILQIIQIILHSAGMFKLLPVIYELHLTHPPHFISLSVYHPL